MNRAIPIAGPEAALTSAQRETLRVLLDMIVPPTADGRMPGAAEMAGPFGPFAGARTTLAALRELLAALDREALAQYSVAFAALDESARVSLLERIRNRDPLVFDGLALDTVTGYYQQDRVLEGLGLEARPPYPKGYPLEAGDLSLLDPVIARGKIYRDV